jgi:putative peptidoglycan lipid II flippase
MGIATAVSRGFGFLRVIVVAAVLGTTALGNTFQSANSVSNVLFELLAAGALSAVLVPTLAAALDRGDQPAAERLAGSLLGRALVVLGVVAVLGVVFAPLLARVLVTGVDDAATAAQQRELATFLLRFFVPQVLLYAIGTVAIAALYARRRFAVTAAAPIGNTIVIVAALLVFRAVAGPDPGLDLSPAEQLLLAVGGTLGVAAFVAVPVIALWRSGFRLRARWGAHDAGVRELTRLSSWAVLQHAGIGVLLGAAIIAGNAVAGGVVAYQFAYVFFLAPYAVLAQPLHTTILPELSSMEPGADGRDAASFAGTVAWALDRMALLVIPVSAAMMALALPAMDLVAFGAARDGVGLLAAALASLAVGLFVYSAFLLLARAYYALGDSRTPAIVAIATALVGAAVMAIGGAVTDGSARVAMLGVGHTVAYVLGTSILLVGLARRTGARMVPHSLVRATVVSTALGFAVWAVARAWDPSTRIGAALLIVVAGGAATVIYGLLWRWTAARANPHEPAPAPDPIDEAIAEEPDAVELET